MAIKRFHGWQEEAFIPSEIHPQFHWQIFTMKRHSGKVVTTAALGVLETDLNSRSFSYDHNTVRVVLRSNTSRATKQNIERSHRDAVIYFDEKKIFENLKKTR
jgi:hypothetical protein